MMIINDSDDYSDDDDDHDEEEELNRRDILPLITINKSATQVSLQIRNLRCHCRTN